MVGNARYLPLIDTVDLARPGVILEVGTHNAHRSCEMIDRALEFRPASEIQYHGFDFWEHLTRDMMAEQFKLKPKGKAKHSTALKRIRQRGVAFYLHGGDSRATLPQHAPKHIDIAFIDGGHEVETIRSDYRALAHARWIVFDDCYLQPHVYGDFGALRIIQEEKLDAEFVGHFRHVDLGDTCMAIVRGGG